MLNINNKDCI